MLFEVRSRSKARSRSTRVVLLVLRAILVTVVLQLSGLPHLAADAFVSDTHACDDGGDDCRDEKSGLDCPPGCPSCHCVHGGVASLPNRIAGDLHPVVMGPSRTLVLRPPAAFVPRPDLPSLFRPPRSLALPA